MKTLAALIMSALFAAIIATPVYAQQPGTSHDQHRPEPAAPAPPSAPGSAMRGGGMPMMEGMKTK